MPKPDVDVQVFLLLVRRGKIEVTAGTSKYAKTLAVKELGKATAKFLEIGAQFSRQRQLLLRQPPPNPPVAVAHHDEAGG
jgi:hypothetical protein